MLLLFSFPSSSHPSPLVLQVVCIWDVRGPPVWSAGDGNDIIHSDVHMFHPTYALMQDRHLMRYGRRRTSAVKVKTIGRLSLTVICVGWNAYKWCARYHQVALSLTVCFWRCSVLKTTVYLWKYSCPTGTHLVSGSDTLMSLKYALNPCMLQARRSRSQGGLLDTCSLWLYLMKLILFSLSGLFCC